jgi:hypothetical protein
MHSDKPWRAKHGLEQAQVLTFSRVHECMCTRGLWFISTCSGQHNFSDHKRMRCGKQVDHHISHYMFNTSVQHACVQFGVLLHTGRCNIQRRTTGVLQKESKHHLSAPHHVTQALTSPHTHRHCKRREQAGITYHPRPAFRDNQPGLQGLALFQAY